LNFKNQGNEAYKSGRKHYADALEFYSKGIDQKCGNIELETQLYSNRAAVHLSLGKKWIMMIMFQ